MDFEIHFGADFKLCGFCLCEEMSPKSDFLAKRKEKSEFQQPCVESVKPQNRRFLQVLPLLWKIERQNGD